MATKRGSLKKVTKPKKKTIPEGAEVESKEVSISAEEIENGWLVTKRIEYRYKPKGEKYTDYLTTEEKSYSKDDPFIPNEEGKELADYFDE